MENKKRLIDVDEAKAALMGWETDPTDEEIEWTIDHIPTIDAVEVVHGQWEMGVDEGGYEYGTCSVCGYNEYNAFCCLLPHNYCPNCGAKMDGDRNGKC